MANRSEYKGFTDLLKRVISTPHEDVKKALDAEKKRKPKKTSASKPRDTKPKAKRS